MKFKRRIQEEPSINLTPLIDVVFLLLIFFMVSTVFVDFRRQMDIALPSSKKSVPDAAPKPIKLEITFDKQIFLNGKKIYLDRLEQTLLKIDLSKKKAAIIRADKHLPYGEVIKVMGILQSAQVLDISVAVK